MENSYNVDKKIGQNIKALRAKRGLSQEDFARALGVTFQQVQKYESGKNRISASKMYQLSVAFDIPIIKFFAEIEPLAKSEIVLSDEECTFITMLRNKDDAFISKILSLAVA